MSATAASRTSTGTVVATGGLLRGVAFASSATGGSLVLKDGGAGGTTKLDLTTPAAAGFHYLEIPGGGIPFTTDMHATLTDVDAVTLIYS